VKTPYAALVAFAWVTVAYYIYRLCLFAQFTSVFMKINSIEW